MFIPCATTQLVAKSCPISDPNIPLLTQRQHSVTSETIPIPTCCSTQPYTTLGFWKSPASKPNTQF